MELGPVRFFQHNFFDEHRDAFLRGVAGERHRRIEYHGRSCKQHLICARRSVHSCFRRNLGRHSKTEAMGGVVHADSGRDDGSDGNYRPDNGSIGR